WQSPLWSPSSLPGLPSSSPARTRRVCSTSWSACSAGVTGSAATPFCWSPISTRHFGSVDMDGSTAAIQRGLMKAIVCRTHGRPDVLRLEEIDRPSVPDDGLLVRVHASSINPVDFFPLSRVAYTARLLSGGLKSKAKVLGIDFAGTVESVGPGCHRLQTGR